MKKLFLFSFIAFTGATAVAQSPEADIAKIRNEALQRSQVMNIAFQLTDVSGPRLTNSPGYMRAAEYAKSTLAGWGLVNANLEPWGEFGKGWELKKSYMAMTSPYYKPVIAFPKTWTEGTGKERSASVLIIDAKDSADLQRFKGKFKNKLVMRELKDTLKFTFKPDATRRDDASLAKMAEAKVPPPDTTRRGPRPGGGGARSLGELVKQMMREEGAIGVLSTSMRGHDGTLFVQGGGAYGKNDPANVTDVVIAVEDYMSIQRLVKSGIDVKLDIDVKTSFQDKEMQSYNVIAEIPGSDPVLKDEWVMLGAHLDSWQGSTGATDNAAGSAVMMEAVRILKTTGVPLKRSVRIALWSGEEQGLLGSRNYVKNHFGERATGLKPEASKISAYYNVDNGSGKIRGIYTQNNTGVVNMFTEWLKPFHDLGATTVTVSNTGGTDHQSFDRIGIPGFQFIQDELEYDTRTHHTNMDSYDHLSAPDLMQASALVAAFVYNTANAPAMLPRK